MGVACSRKCSADPGNYYFDPLKCPLPNAPSMNLYCLYGIGVPTERSYYYVHRVRAAVSPLCACCAQICRLTCHPSATYACSVASAFLSCAARIFHSIFGRSWCASAASGANICHNINSLHLDLLSVYGRQCGRDDPFTHWLENAHGGV